MFLKDQEVALYRHYCFGNRFTKSQDRSWLFFEERDFALGNFKKSFVLLASTGIMLMLSYYLLFVTLSIPYVGLSVEKNEIGTWHITKVDHLGWAEQQGIKVGEIVSLVNDIQPSEYLTIMQYGAIEQAETIVVNRNGQLTSHKITKDVTSEQVQYHIVMPIQCL